MAKPQSTLAAMRPFGFAREMKRLAAFFAFCLTLALLIAEPLQLTLDNALLPSPAGVGAHSPHLVATGTGQVLLSWIEPGPDDTAALYFAQFDPKTHAWAKPSLIGPANAIPAPSGNLNEPATTSNAGRLATAWFVADKKDPRVLLSTSPDAGQHFLMPQRIEDAQPIGAPALALLADGTVFVAWPEQANPHQTALWLRRISPGGNLSVPVRLATLPAATQPSLALIKDYDTTPAQLLLVYPLGDAGVSQIITRLLTLPRPETAKTANPCNCPTGDEAARGHALKGRIISFAPERGTLRVKHEDVAGVLPAATTEFRIDPATQNLATTGNELFARIEKRDNTWWLFDARLIVRPEMPSTQKP